MPARLLLTKAQRDALLPDTEEAFVRHYSFSGEDVEILWRYRTPETRLAFALQLCILRYPGRVVCQGEVILSLFSLSSPSKSACRRTRSAASRVGRKLATSI